MARCLADLCRALTFVSIFLTLTSLLPAQMPVSTSSTSTPVPGAGHDYLGDLNETVNPVNGSLSIRIKTPMPPGRGFTLPFSFAYDSNGVNYVSGLKWKTPTQTINSVNGWSNTIPVVSVDELDWTGSDPDHGSHPCRAYVDYVYQGADGTRHNLNLTTFKDAGNPDSVCVLDSSEWPAGFGGAVVTQGGEARPGAIMASIPAGTNLSPGIVTVMDADGTSLQFPDRGGSEQNGSLASSVEDRNGNVLYISQSNCPGGAAYCYTDTVGRTVLADSGFAVNPESVTISGLVGNYTLAWENLTTSSFNSPYNSVSGNCTFNNYHQTGGTVLHTLTLPNTTQTFTFSYDDPYGLVSEIQYPNGGTVQYTWGMPNNDNEMTHVTTTQGVECYVEYGVPVITDRVVKFDGQTTALHQHFVYSPNWSGTQPGSPWKTTTVTTTDLLANTTSTTVYTYSAMAADIPPNTSGGPTAVDAVESSIAYSDSINGLLKTVTKTWTNPRLMTRETTSYPNGQSSKISETDWTYNSREMETEQDDYDFGDNARGTLLRTVDTFYQSFNLNFYGSNQSIADRPCQVITYDGSGTRVAETDSFYDNGSTGTPCGAAGTPSVTAVTGTLTGHDETNYAASKTTPRGNVTQKTQWLNTGTSPVTTYTYDETGQVLSMTDPNQNQTSYSYTDSFYDPGFSTTAGSPPSGTVTNAYVSRITYPVVNGVSHTKSFAYGYNDGQLTQETDENSRQTTYQYYDSMDRIKETDFPDGGKTTANYHDAVPSVDTTKIVTSTASVSTTTTMDGYAHKILSQLTTDPDGMTSTTFTYDGLGRKHTETNPHRSGSSSTDGTMTYTYDGIGRITQVAKADGSIASTSYLGNQSTVTDEAGNQRTSQTDALGRLTKVWEAPNNASYNYLTVYGFDALGNLNSVTQNGSHGRSFVYDSLGRLTSATNPESGTITYTYDANGNVQTKTAPFPDCTSNCSTVTTTYQYDALNRLIKKSYSSGANMPVIQFGYDGVALTNCTTAPPILSDSNKVGARTSMCDGSGATAWTHDSMGRILSQQQVQATSSTTSQTASIGYQYNLDGSVQSITYPSGRTLTYIYNQGANSASQVVSITDSTGPINYVSQATYAPPGELATASYGSGISISNSYNSRLQPSTLSAANTLQTIFSLTYNFSPGTDNGTVRAIVNNLDSTRSMTFSYDPLNRLAQANTTTTSGGNCWGEAYIIDAWGNLTNINPAPGMAGGCLMENLNNPVGTNNRVTTFCYDAAGNLLDMASCPLQASHTFVYDAEGQLQSPPVSGANGGISYLYYYDGDGNRVQKCNANPCPSGTTAGTLYWRDPNGVVLDESNRTGTMQEEYIYFNGQRMARRDVATNTVHYYFSDQLGSASVITDSSGNLQQQMDFYPFGGVAYTSGADTNRYKFTGKERDSESGLDDFGARFYASIAGRFMTPDWAARPTGVPYAVYGDPQSLNLYAYVRNDPVTRADADGHAGHEGETVCSAHITSGCVPAPSAQNTATTLHVTNESTVVNKDGSITTSRTTVALTLSTEKGKEGQFVGATTETLTMTSGSATAEPFVVSGQKSLSYGDAVHAIGADAMASAVQATQPLYEQHLAHQMVQDVIHHPLGTLGTVVASAGIPVAHVCPLCGAGMAIAGELLHSADSAKDATPYP